MQDNMSITSLELRSEITPTGQRLLRREVEDLVRAQSGDRYLQERKARTEGVCRKLAAVLRL